MTKPAIDSSQQLRRIAAGAAALAACLLIVGGILLLPRSNSNRMRVGDHEQRALLQFQRAAGNPLKLHAFLDEMPKGGDLHMHLSGAIYAETFLQDAIADKACIDPVTFRLDQKHPTAAGLRQRPATRSRCVEGPETLRRHCRCFLHAHLRSQIRH